VPSTPFNIERGVSLHVQPPPQPQEDRKENPSVSIGEHKHSKTSPAAKAPMSQNAHLIRRMLLAEERVAAEAMMLLDRFALSSP
jgi:hypothetical protein